MTPSLVRQLVLAAAFALAATPAVAQSRSLETDSRSSLGLPGSGGRVFDQDSDGDSDSDSDGYRDDRGRKAKKAKKAGKKCWDVDRNGYCDDVQRRSPRCDDRDGDRRCDDVHGPVRTFPTTLPDMAGAILVSRGRTSSDVSRWLGARPLTVRTEATRGRIRRATWYDRSGELLQAWTDRDLDGQADVVQVYRGGRIVRTIRRS